MNLDEMKKTCAQCRNCVLSRTRTNTVFGVGPTDSPIMFVGEGPGQQEDLMGEPFVGAAGKLLDDMLSIIELSRKNCYITNVVKCRPPGNRDPLPEEKTACSSFLKEQFSVIRPKIVICLGRISAGELIHDEYRITREHGTWTEKDGTCYTAIYHPSALLRDLEKRPETFRDLISIREKIKEVCPEFYDKQNEE